MNSNLKNYLKYEAKLELARREFWYYCKLKAPDFYKEDREYLKDLCNKLQDFLSNDKKVLIVNIMPRAGKSRTISMFIQWLLGVDKTQKIISCSYNELLSTQFSKTIRNTIQEQKGDKDKVVYNDIFPQTKIQRGDGSANLWSLQGGYNNYLATSPNASSTGFGASILILDDIIKSAYEAHNEIIKEGHWEWFTSTLLSRLENNGKIICIMTRWSNTDISARLLQAFPQEQVEHIIYKAYDNNKMLCEEILSYDEYKEKQKLIPPDIFNSNYLQEPVETKGQLYQTLRTYTELPQINEVFMYCDTADTGSDYLCSIVFTYYQKDVYILDVIYTKQPMETTEKQVAKQLFTNKVNRARIESNNGGRGFARNVKNILETNYKYFTQITTFHQTKNKQARILTASSYIEEHVYFPNTWHIKWEEFYKHITNYQREGKNAHDDAEDCLTGCVETVRQIYHI